MSDKGLAHSPKSAHTQRGADGAVVSGQAGWSLKGEHEWDECSVQFSGDGSYHTIYEPGRRLPVAFVIGAEGYWRDNEAETRANARLIAAAPDLKSAGIHLLSAFMDAETARGNIRAEQHPAYVEMRAAIAKATGADQ